MARSSHLLGTFLLLALLPTWTQARPNTTSSDTMPGQYVLCEKDLEIDILKESHGLIQVGVTPTHAAMHPSWPTALSTIIINICIMLWSRFTKYGVYPNRLTPFLLPLSMISFWFTTFVTTQLNSTSAGWISTNLTTFAALIATLIDAFIAIFVYGDSRRPSPSPSPLPHLIPIITLLSLLAFQTAATLAVIIQRLTASNEYGTIAYAITNTHGCTPNESGDFSFLQRGVRSRIFAIVQIAQLVYSVVVILALIPFALGKGRRMARETIRKLDYSATPSDGVISHPHKLGKITAWLVAARGFARCMQLCLPVASLVAGFPLLVYGVMIATRGVPVVMSGDCMLVEMSPRFGFVDGGEVELWWRVLVVAVGH
ncbi:hypothetical protein B0T14DRAFT_518229 [Immersiella caudata]|uniref:Uncharacterized protein n=1 Tax=Immersiella caudata TaxID=314043 RepID=A0AA39WP42_9PEZI|nr:hypothetical protein B0T14DRAFT_518229 [Immersiella caudata]